jgi:hypothetical protein
MTRVKGHPNPNIGICTVATVPTDVAAGDIIFVTNALAASQTTGNGTGNLAYYNGTAWMRVDTGVAIGA